MLVAMIWTAVHERAVRAAVVEQARAVAVPDEDRVAARHALLLDAHVGGEAATDVHDLRGQRHEPLGAVVRERQVVAEGGQPPADRAAAGAMVQQRERIQDRLGVWRLKRSSLLVEGRRDLGLRDLGGRLGRHGVNHTRRPAEQRQPLIRGHEDGRYAAVTLVTAGLSGERQFVLFQKLGQLRLRVVLARRRVHDQALLARSPW